MNATNDVPNLVRQVADYLHVDGTTIEDVLPCSPLQEGLVALSLQQPGSYMAQFAYDVPASIDPKRLQDAWQVIVDSSPILRTRVVQSIHSSSLLQVVMKHATTDWRKASDLQTYLKKGPEAAMGIGDPLLRPAFIIKPGECRSILTMHHEIYDEQSLHLLWTSVNSVYAGTAMPLRIPFSAFIHHIQEMDTESPIAFLNFDSQDCPALSFPSLPSTAIPF
jgi:hypothetical protein